MNAKQITKAICILIISLLISSCGPGPLFGPTSTLTPTPTLTLTRTHTPTLTPTLTLTPTITPTPTPYVATFDDNLCDIKGSFLLDGQLIWTAAYDDGFSYELEVEGSPSYAMYLFGLSEFGATHFLTIWVKHSSSPGPNEVETLPNQFKKSDINIYTSDNTVLFPEGDQVRLKLHVFSLKTEEPAADPLSNCAYVVEEIHLR